jgi:TolC family type I secretion outer membrane protein
MKFRGIFLLTLLLGTAFVPSAQAAETLFSLYQRALEYDARYRSVLANTEAEREELNKARSLFFPKAQLTLNVGDGSTERTANTIVGPVESQYDYTLKNYAVTIRQPLFNKESMAFYRTTEATIQGREALLEKEHSTLITRLAAIYFEILYAQERLRVAGNKITAVQRQLDQAQRRYTHGEGTVTEINEAQANLDLARAEEIEARHSLDIHHQSLADITGLTMADIAEVDVGSLLSGMPEFASVENWLRDAEAHNADVVQARHALEAARHDVERKRAGHYPTLDLVGVRSHSENDNNNTIGLEFDTTTLALQFNMPLYAGGYTSASVRQALDSVRAAEEQLNLRLRDALTRVKQYFNSIQSGLLAIEAYEQAVRSAEIALTGTEKGFTAGLRTNIDVLNAQQKLFASRLDLSRARYSLLNDIINIRQVTGMLDASQLKSLNRYFRTSQG